MNTPEYPTPWQKKSIWAALTTLSVVSIGAIAVGLIWTFSSVVAFLQPILVPFAVAGVLAYLLEPVVAKVVSWGTSRKRAVLAVFAVVSLLLTGILIWILPAIWNQTGNLARKVPAYRQHVEHMAGSYNDWAHSIEEKYGVHMPQVPKKIENPLKPPAETPAETPPPSDNNSAANPAAKSASPEAAPATTSPAPAPVAAPTVPATTPSSGTLDHPPTSIDVTRFLQGDWLRFIWSFLIRSVGGFLGVIGPLLSLIIVPIYLYYFLIESKNIAESWSDYLPLRASAFKDEVIAALEEINGYLIAFFRGQLLVSMINGTVTGILLVIFGLDFGILIGLMLCFLGIIPYIGITLCWVPAVLIAMAQGGNGTWVPGDPWWLFPLVVTAIFFLVQQIDGLFVTPKIVGESVGLHPVTVIFSVFIWGLLLGGLLGAILAVPLTATLKVLLRRYVWERQMRNEELPAPLVTEETLAVQDAQLTDKEPLVKAPIAAGK